MADRDDNKKFTIEIIMKNFKYIFILITLILTAAYMLFFTKGYAGSTVIFQNDYNTQVLGPFEASNSTSRYALTEAIAKHKTFIFNETQARFSSPDVSEYNGKFFSTFTPGVSFIGVPFYLLGNLFGLPQIFTYFSVLIFSVINLFLVAKLAGKFGANLYASILSGFVFSFATNALPYAQTFTQHAMSATFTLLALLNALQKRTIINNILLGIYSGAGLLIDIPNLIITAPIILYVLFSHIDVKKINEKVNIKLKLAGLSILIGVIPFIILFGIYNFETTGSYTIIGQTIGRSEHFSFQSSNPNNLPNKQVDNKEEKNYLINVPFQTRKQINGYYTLLFSNERSWIYYSPVILLGILGLILAYRNPKSSTIARLGACVVLINIVTYAMFIDPWGGWAFGPRYLIPSAAVLAGGLGYLLLKWAKKPVFIIIFFLLFTYSVGISVLGALTTNSIAPKVEAEQFKPAIPYTYEYNLKFIDNNRSGNLLYNSWLYNYLTLKSFWYLSTAVIVLTGMLGYLYLFNENGGRHV